MEQKYSHISAAMDNPHRFGLNLRVWARRKLQRQLWKCCPYLRWVTVGVAVLALFLAANMWLLNSASPVDTYWQASRLYSGAQVPGSERALKLELDRGSPGGGAAGSAGGSAGGSQCLEIYAENVLSWQWSRFVGGLKCRATTPCFHLQGFATGRVNRAWLPYTTWPRSDALIATGDVSLLGAISWRVKRWFVRTPPIYAYSLENPQTHRGTKHLFKHGATYTGQYDSSLAKNVVPENYWSYSSNLFAELFAGKQLAALRYTPLPLNASGVTNGAIWTVSNCRVRSRNALVAGLRSAALFPIDIAGSCEQATVRSEESRDKSRSDHFYRKYRFKLALENSRSHDYVTEKVLDPLYYAVIPVYLGAPNARELLPRNSTIFIDDFRTPGGEPGEPGGTVDYQKLAAFMSAVMQNETLFQSFHAWRTDLTELTRLRDLNAALRESWVCRVARHAGGLVKNQESNNTFGVWNVELQQWMPRD